MMSPCEIVVDYYWREQVGYLTTLIFLVGIVIIDSIDVDGFVGSRLIYDVSP